MGEDDLTTDLEGLREVRGGEFFGVDAERDGLDSADVRGDILADGAVAAGEAAGEVGGVVRAGLVVEGEREAVELELADVAELLGAGQRLLNALAPGAKVGLVVGVVEREHGAGVRGLHEALVGLAADALGGRVGRDEAGMLGLEHLEAVHEGVVLRVRKDGRVEDVVEVLVVNDLVAEGLDLVEGIGRGGGRFGRHRSRL